MDKKILVIEDDQIASRLIEYALSKKGYRVLTAKNGLEGINKARNEKPDLLILDIMLPGMDGFEVCHRLRGEPQTAQLPIIMLSGKAQEIDKTTGMKVGADDYITKPASPRELIKRVEGMFARKAAAKSKIIAFIGTKEGVGTTTTAVNVAVTLAQRGKRVIIADLSPEDGKISEHLGLKPELDIIRLLTNPVDAVEPKDLEASLVVHHTGVRVLALPQEGDKKPSPTDINLLFERLKEVTDYIIVDLPSPPAASDKVTLTKCDLVIIVTDFKTGALLELKSTSALLNKLGIKQERLGAVVIDRGATMPEVGFSNMKPLIELNAKVSLLGVIPYELKASLEVEPTNPVILSNPDSPMAWSIREVARHISN